MKTVKHYTIKLIVHLIAIIIVAELCHRYLHPFCTSYDNWLFATCSFIFATTAAVFGYYPPLKTSSK